MSDLAIRVRGLSKFYTIRHQQRVAESTLAESLMKRIRRPLGSQATSETFWALKDVDFDVKKGDVVGVIGRNGAGKSTLLKILSRITEPTSGRIELFGRIGSLLEVGTGFHPELTGRENIYLNGNILGMSRTEIRKQFDAIVDFAGVEQFLDTPVKRYSSGMYVRLAFAVAAHLQSEILIVDEVLAVGDAEFQRKCIGKMKDFASGGRTVVFVSHQINAVRELCNQCIILRSGQIDRSGPSPAMLDHYIAGPSETLAMWQNSGTEFGDAVFVPIRFAVLGPEGRPLAGTIPANMPIRVVIDGEVQREHVALNVGVAVYAAAGELLFWSVSTDGDQEDWPELRRGPVSLLATIPPHLLNEGNYRLELMVSLHHIEWVSEPGRNAPTITVRVHGGLSASPYWMEPRPGLLAPVLSFATREVVTDLPV